MRWWQLDSPAPLYHWVVRRAEHASNLLEAKRGSLESLEGSEKAPEAYRDECGEEAPRGLAHWVYEVSADMAQVRAFGDIPDPGKHPAETAWLEKQQDLASILNGDMGAAYKAATGVEPSPMLPTLALNAWRGREFQEWLRTAAIDAAYAAGCARLQETTS